MLKKLLAPKALFENWLVLTRVVTALLIFVHGLGVFSKGHMEGNVAWLTDLHFPLPVLMSYIGKGAELIGGILLVFGLMTRFTALILIINMIIITFVLGKGKIFTDDQHPFLLLLLFVYIFFTGAGKISMDNLLFNKTRQASLHPKPLKQQSENS